MDGWPPLMSTTVILNSIFVLTPAVEFRIIDLTHELSETTIYWPGNPPYNLTILSRGQMANFWYESNYIAQAEHGGTHLDAPAHFYEGGQRTSDVPLDKLHGAAAIIDVKEKVRINPDYRVSIQDIEDWESKYKRLPENSAVIMNSGWGNKYPNKTLVFGTDTPDNSSTFHFPAFHEDTVTWLANERSVTLIGVDTPSTDYGQSTTFPVHVVLASKNISALENVANLDSLPPRGSQIFAPVIKTKDGSGGPVRCFALIFETEEEKTACGGLGTMTNVQVFVLLLALCVSTLLIILRS